MPTPTSGANSDGLPAEPPVEPPEASPDGPPAWSKADLAGDPHATPDKAERVRAMFEAISARYDLNNRIHSFGRDVAWRRRAVAEAGLRSGDEVLDVACGTGDLAEALAAAKPSPCRVVGVDFTAGMLEIARHKARRRRTAIEIDYRLGDAMDLEFPDASFDVATIAFGLRNVADPPRAIAEFRRVLRAGGRLVVLEFSEPRIAPIRWFNRLYTEGVMPRTAAILARDRSGAYRYLPRSVASFPGVETVGRWIEDAGFEGLRQRPLTFGVCTIHAATVPSDGGRCSESEESTATVLRRTS